MVKRTNTKAALKGMSTAELKDLLDKKLAQDRKRLTSLKAKRAKVAARLKEVESAIAAIEGPKPKRRRAPKKKVTTVMKAAKKRSQTRGESLR